MNCPMRGALAALLGVVAAVAANAQDVPTAASAQREEILALLKGAQSAFDNSDAAGLAACWTPKGEFIVPSGEVAEGRSAIEKLYKDAFTGRKQATLLLHIERFRMVNDGLARSMPWPTSSPPCPATARR